MKQAFLNQLISQGISLTKEQREKYLDDFKSYCEEMEFTTEAEIIEGAKEYVTCQIHYGIFR